MKYIVPCFLQDKNRIPITTKGWALFNVSNVTLLFYEILFLDKKKETKNSYVIDMITLRVVSKRLKTVPTVERGYELGVGA